MTGGGMGLNGYLVVFAGAGIGGMLRHGVNTLSSRLGGPDLPWGTLTVNVIGSLLLGAIAGYLTVETSDQSWRLFTVTGLIGG